MGFYRRYPTLFKILGFIFIILPNTIDVYWDLYNKSREVGINLMDLGIWRWLIPLIGLLILLGGYWYDHQRNKQLAELMRANTASLDIDSIKINPHITKIEQPQKPNRLPLLFNIVMAILCSMVFGFGVFSLYLWIDGKIQQELNTFLVIQWLVFYACFIGIPIWLVVSLFLERKYIKSGQSHVAKRTSFIYKADKINDVFVRCYKVLSVMGAEAPTQMRMPKLIKSQLDKSYITVNIKYKSSKTYEVDILSDALRVEIRWDFGRNKRNISTFKKLMLLDEGK